MKKSILKQISTKMTLALIACCLATCTFGQITANPYPVQNSLACNVDITYQYLSSACAPIGTCSGAITIGASGTTFIPACAGAYDIEITVVTFDTFFNVTQATIPVSSTCGTNGSMITSNPFCNCPNNTSITMNANGATIP
jgi:hypothetical protein